jgi:Dullard-like phosphatase family protein
MTSTLLEIVQGKIESFVKTLNEFKIESLRENLMGSPKNGAWEGERTPLNNNYHRGLTFHEVPNKYDGEKTPMCMKRQESAKLNELLTFSNFKNIFKEVFPVKYFSRLDFTKISKDLKFFTETAVVKKEEAKESLSSGIGGMKSTVEFTECNFSENSSTDSKLDETGNEENKNKINIISLESESKINFERIRENIICKGDNLTDSKYSNSPNSRRKGVNGFSPPQRSKKSKIKDNSPRRKPTEQTNEHEEVNSRINSHVKIYDNEQWEENFATYYIDASQNYSSNFDNYLNGALKLINLLPEIDWEEDIKKKTIHLQPILSNKKTLILDLDETLIHCDIDFMFPRHDKILSLENPSEQTNTLIPLILRPELKEFLEFCSENFEVILFTASCSDYADLIINFIDPEGKYFSRRLYRESCLFVNPGIYIKDLRIFENRDMKNVIIVDNSLLSFAHQLSNGILVTSFYNDKEDKILDSVIGYLKQMVIEGDDVRVVNRDVFRFEEYKEELKVILKEELLICHNEHDHQEKKDYD